MDSQSRKNRSGWRRALTGTLASGALAAAMLVTAPASQADVLDQIGAKYMQGAGGGQLSVYAEQSLNLRAQGFRPSQENLAALQEGWDFLPNQSRLLDALKSTVAYQRKVQMQSQFSGGGGPAVEAPAWVPPDDANPWVAPEYDITTNDLPGGHREYEIVCRLTHRATGRFVGQGVGVCTTMESKYRYRSESTGQQVPKAYWDDRDPELLGGNGYSARKVDGKWMIFHRVAHDNPADYYNTVKKIAKKRAYNDAILTATGASDIFAPDDDTDPEFLGDDIPAAGASKPPVQQPQRRSAGNGNGADKAITEKQAGLLRSTLEKRELTETECCKKFGVTKLEELPFAKLNDALAWEGGE